MLSKFVRDYCEQISTNEIGNLKITDEINLFRNRPWFMDKNMMLNL